MWAPYSRSSQDGGLTASIMQLLSSYRCCRPWRMNTARGSIQRGDGSLSRPISFGKKGMADVFCEVRVRQSCGDSNVFIEYITHVWVECKYRSMRVWKPKPGDKEGLNPVKLVGKQKEFQQECREFGSYHVVVSSQEEMTAFLKSIGAVGVK